MKTQDRDSNFCPNDHQIQQGLILNQIKLNPLSTNLRPRQQKIDGMDYMKFKQSNYLNLNNVVEAKENNDSAVKEGGTLNQLFALIKSWFRKDEDNPQQQKQSDHQQMIENRQSLNLLENHPCNQSQYVKMRQSIDEVNCPSKKQSIEIVGSSSLENIAINMQQKNLNQQNIKFDKSQLIANQQNFSKMLQQKKQLDALASQKIKHNNRKGLNKQIPANTKIHKTINFFEKKKFTFSKEKQRIQQTTSEQQQINTKIELPVIDKPQLVLKSIENTQHQELKTIQQQEKIVDNEVEPFEVQNKQSIEILVTDQNTKISQIPIPKISIPLQSNNVQKYFYQDGQLQANLDAMDDTDLNNLIANYINGSFVGMFLQNSNAKIDKIAIIESAVIAAQKELVLQKQGELQQLCSPGDCLTENPDNQNNGKDQPANYHCISEAPNLTTEIQQDNIKKLIQHPQQGMQNNQEILENKEENIKQYDQRQFVQIQNQLEPGQPEKQIETKPIADYIQIQENDIFENNQEAVEVQKLQQTSSSKLYSKEQKASKSTHIPQFINNICANPISVLEQQSNDQIILIFNAKKSSQEANSDIFSQKDDNLKSEVIQTNLPTIANIFDEKPVDVNNNINIFEQKPAVILQQNAQQQYQQQQQIPFSLQFGLQAQDNPFNAAAGFNLDGNKLPVALTNNNGNNIQQQTQQINLFQQQNIAQQPQQFNQNNMIIQNNQISQMGGIGKQILTQFDDNYPHNQVLFNPKNDLPMSIQMDQQIPAQNLQKQMQQNQQCPQNLENQFMNPVTIQQNQQIFNQDYQQKGTYNNNQNFNSIFQAQPSQQTMFFQQQIQQQQPNNQLNMQGNQPLVNNNAHQQNQNIFINPPAQMPMQQQNQNQNNNQNHNNNINLFQQPSNKNQLACRSNIGGGEYYNKNNKYGKQQRQRYNDQQ